jgi:subtilisin family serine protease
VERAKQFRSQNKHARAVTQSLSGKGNSVWAQGLRGEGQVVALADTGIDTDSCYFHDPDHAVPIGRNTIDYQHRKFVAYVNIADARDDISGHGSHVAGSLAGECIANLVSNNNDSDVDYAKMASYNGMVPRAKLAFYDIKSGPSEDLEVPNNVYLDL